MVKELLNHVIIMHLSVLYGIQLYAYNRFSLLTLSAKNSLKFILENRSVKFVSYLDNKLIRILNRLCVTIAEVCAHNTAKY